MGKKRTAATDPPAEPSPRTELDRCHARWLNLWFGVMGTLEAEDPKAYSRVLVKLEKHGLVGDVTETKNGRAYLVPSGALTRPVPSSSILCAADAFCGDHEVVSLRGKTRGRPPLGEILMYYYGALWHVGQAPSHARVEDSAQVRAWKLVAQRYGYRGNLETPRKLVKQAQRKAPQNHKALLRRSGKVLWELYQSR